MSVAVQFALGGGGTIVSGVSSGCSATTSIVPRAALQLPAAAVQRLAAEWAASPRRTRARLFVLLFALEEARMKLADLASG